MPQRFLLLSLPPELRLIIYKHVIHDDKIRRHKGIISRLLRVNKKVYGELAVLLQKEFRFYHVIMSGSALALLTGFSYSITLTQQRTVESAAMFKNYHLEMTIRAPAIFRATWQDQHLFLVNEEFTHFLDSLGSYIRPDRLQDTRRLRCFFKFLPHLPREKGLRAQLEREFEGEIAERWEDFKDVEFKDATIRDWAKKMREERNRNEFLLGSAA